VRTLVASAFLLLAACNGAAVPSDTPAAGSPVGPDVSSPAGPGVPSPAEPGVPSPALPTAPGASAPAAGSPAAGEVEALGPSADLSGERMFTIGDVATVENVSTLTVRQAERGPGLSAMPPPEGQTAYTFLVVFAWDGTTPGPISIGGGYYNAINFSLRDDEDFEYPVIQGTGFARQPELLFGDLAAGQQVQGWVTFFAPGDAEFVELTYRPIADEAVFFRVEPAG